MNYLICTFADENLKDRNYMATYQVRKVVDEKDYTDDMLVNVADLYNEQDITKSRKMGFVFTDEEIPRAIKTTYYWNGVRYIDPDGEYKLNMNVIKIIRK